MRIFYLSLFSVVLFSCSPQDDSEQTAIKTTNMPMDFAIAKDERHPASDSLNPYDSSGRLFDDLFVAYYQDTTATLPLSTSGILARLDTIANANAGFTSLKPIGYTMPTASSIDVVLSDPTGCVDTYISASSLSTKGRTSLSAFIKGVVPVFDEATDFAPVHEYIRAFEAATLNDTLLNANDRKIMLMTSSIARYSAYRGRKKPKKKKEDPEWDLLITHLTGGAEGAELNVCDAVLRALATGIKGQ